MSHNYDYYPCSRCGQRVAHTKAGEPLHMHRRSKRCQLTAENNAKARRIASMPRGVR